MIVAEKITQKIASLPVSVQTEILDYVEFVAQKNQLREVETETWSEFSLNQTTSGVEIPSEEMRQKRMNWLKANQAKYGGQFVALDGDRLLGTAQSFVECKEIVVKAGVPNAFVNYLSKPDEEGYLGGW